MKITIATLGSRGDVQPFLALAVALSRAGHAVRLATNEPFRGLVGEHGVEFTPLGGDIREIVGDRGRAELRAAEGRPLRTMRALREHVGPLVRDGLRRLASALEGADVIMGQLLVPGAVHYARHHRVPYFEVGYDPVFPTRAFPHPGAPPTLPPGLPSRFTYLAAEQVFWQAFRRDVDAFRREALGVGRAPFFGPSERIGDRPPTLLGYSNVLIPRPPDWPDHVRATGAWLLDPPPSFVPEPRLVDFLGAGPPPLYVGFGSMTAPHPERMTQALLGALRRARCRAVLSTGWGGFSEAHAGDDVLFIGDVPHAWLFPRVSAVVHHGGAGTTAEALRAGVPQLVVPFLADQPFWGHHVARAGVGPAPVPIGAFSSAALADALLRMRAPRMRTAAQHFARLVNAERGAEEAVEVMERLLQRVDIP